jgi:hypothetical protein
MKDHTRRLVGVVGKGQQEINESKEVTPDQLKDAIQRGKKAGKYKPPR